jgi:hypothetical protein
MPLRPQDLEVLESVTQDVAARDLFLRMARLSAAGSIGMFLVELSADGDLDAETKQMVAEVACDRTFLLALDAYVHGTRLVH